MTRLSIGGPSFHTILLTDGLNNERFESRLVVGVEEKDEGNLLELAKQRNVIPFHVSTLCREISPLRDLVSFWRLFRLIRRYKPTVVHTHLAKAGVVGRLAAKLAGVPIIVHTFHGHLFQGYFGRAETRFYITVERLMARFFSDRIIAVGELLREDLLNYRIAPPKKLVAVPLGLELDPFIDSRTISRDELRQELNLPPDAPLVGIVARLVPIKNHRCFFDAARIIHERMRNVHFVVVGDGELRHDLETYVEQLGIGENTHFLGWRHDLPRIYAGLDIVALSSLNEGLPTAIIEAMAAGKPVVATDVGSVRDLVFDGECGYVVPPKDAKALADALLDLLQSPETMEKMGKTARDHVYPRYDASTLLRNVESLYREVAAEKGIAFG